MKSWTSVTAHLVVASVVVAIGATGCQAKPRAAAARAGASSEDALPSPVTADASADARDHVGLPDAADTVRSFCNYLRTRAADSESTRAQDEMRRWCVQELTDLLASGAIVTSRSGWARCEAYLRIRNGPLGHEIRDAFACSGLFVPLVERGKPCSSRFVCTDGLFCDDVVTHTCVPRVPKGATCVQTLMGNPCARGQYCAAGVCQHLPSTGEKCSGHCEAPAFCIDDVCVTNPGALGQRCQPGVDGCREGLYCALATQRCEPRRPRGATCDSHEECESGACITPLRSGPTACR